MPLPVNFLNYYSDSSNYGDKVPKYTEAQALDIAKSFADKYSNKEYINTDSDLEASDKIDESLIIITTIILHLKERLTDLITHLNILV